MPEITLKSEDERMRTLVKEVAKALVNEDQEVRVELLEDSDGMTLRLHVAESDVCKVIGKQGRTARSLRAILSAASMEYKRRYTLYIVGGEPSQQSE